MFSNSSRTSRVLQLTKKIEFKRGLNMKKRKLVLNRVIVSLFVSLLFVSGTSAFAAQNTNKAWVDEHIQLYYDGYIQFKPCFKVPANAGYYLTEEKYVERAYVNFTRDGESVTTNGGRLYTFTASSNQETSLYSAKARAYDSLNPWAPKTKFKYGWIYF